MPINISNSKNRDAVVVLDGVRPKRDIKYIDRDHRPVVTRKLLKTDIKHDLERLLRNSGDLPGLGQDLMDGDPEIDAENFGKFLSETSRVYVTEDGNVVHSVEEYEVIRNPDRTERERRLRKKEPQNINTETPLRWTGKFIKKGDAVKRFVFTSKKQLQHVNGLTFDFLYEIARELAERDSLLLVRGGENGKSPLILQRGGKNYNAFLEGRIDGERYCLILHLSNMELKKPVVEEETGETKKEKDGEKDEVKESEVKK